MATSIEPITASDSRFMFEISGEHKTLPKAEIEATLEALGMRSTTIEDEPGILVIEVPDMDIRELKSRLAMSHNIDSYFLSSDVNELIGLKRPLKIGIGSFAVRTKRIQNFHEDVNLKELERIVADCVSGEADVDLANPINEIRVIVSEQAHVGIRLAKIDRSAFEARKVQKRPYFSPVSLHPRLARALVNLSRVRRGEHLHDPFCGTGGILMEASLVGVNASGSDIDSKMVQGSKDNLQKFHMDDIEVFQSDVGGVSNTFENVDAIATDPPYGKSATTNREDIKSLYERAFSAFTDVLKMKGHLSIVLPSEELVDMGKNYLELQECHPMRVHRSLTRNFCVYQN
jgi:tRNA (guanine10-N2)-dimethyltransferase